MRLRRKHDPKILLAKQQNQGKRAKPFPYHACFYVLLLETDNPLLQVVPTLKFLRGSSNSPLDSPHPKYHLSSQTRQSLLQYRAYANALPLQFSHKDKCSR